MKYFRRTRTKSTSEEVLFSSQHPLYSTHCIGKHRYEVVPVVTGIRMPFVNDESPLDIVVKRCKIALILFKPFRNSVDLARDSKNGDEWQRAFSEWELSRSTFVQEIMDNMDDYYRARDKASLALDEFDTASLHSSDASDSGDDLDGLDEYMETDEFEEIDCIYGCEYSDFDCSTLLKDDHIPETDELNPKLYPTSQQRCDIVDVLVEKSLLASSAQLTVEKHTNIRNALQVGDCFAVGNDHLSVNELRRWVKDPESDDDWSLQNSNDNDRPTEVIELLSEALLPENMAWNPNSRQLSSPAIEPYASLQSISQAKSLNERQHIAFCIAGKALLNRFYQQELAKQATSGAEYSSAEYESCIERDQLLMILGGAGGTGRTRVIDAISSLCCNWHRESAKQNTALTGKVATLICGRTLASFLLRINHAIKRRECFELDLLAINEISMISKLDWVKLDKLLRRYKKLAGIPFRGVHVILVGDFLQMPPVGSDPIYIDPTTKITSSITDTSGFELWRRFTKVIVLEESMRFQKDPEWGEGCRNARLGEWTPQFIRLINSRLVSNSPELTIEGNNSVCVIPENATRLSINNAFVAEAASLLPSHLYPVRVVADFQNKLHGLSRSDVELIMGLPDNRFGRLAPYLDLIAGMPIQVTQNVATTKGVANGTLGTLEHIHFPGGTAFRLARDSKSKVVVQIPSHPPDYAILRVARDETATPIRVGISSDLFPVFYNTESYKESSISLPPAPNGLPRKLAV